jgi:hypothetical protein
MAIRSTRDLFGRRTARPRDRNGEARRQAAIVDYVRRVAPDVEIWHVPNGGLRSKAEAGRMKWVGVLAGVYDLTLALPGGRAAYWECKTPWGQLSQAQCEWSLRMLALGHHVALVRSIDDARAELERYGIVTRESGVRSKQVTLFEAFDGASFESEEECAGYEKRNLWRMLVGLAEADMKDALEGRNPELAAAIVRVAQRLRYAARKAGASEAENGRDVEPLEEAHSGTRPEARAE